jgi:Methyltransferase domain
MPLPRSVSYSLGYILDKLPYVSRLRKSERDAGAFPPGDLLSPIPSRTEVLARLQSMRTTKPEFSDITFNEQEQVELLRTFAGFYGELPFPDNKSEDCRYHYNQTVFCHPDAIFLYSFLRHTKPSKIIEVGSGFSSGVILDTVERFFPVAPEITFIEPYPARLNRMLRPSDRGNVTVIENRLQTVPLNVFASLGSGDLLFIDSSHVLKCGSDVQYLLFDVLPRLPVGIYVHFHDIFESFEYLESWLLQGWYWNEAYFLRAFLAYNTAWKICFFNNYINNHFRDFLSEKMPLCLKNIGGSIYLRRVQ